MRVFQIETFYTRYLERFYANPEAAGLGYRDQVDGLMLGGFSAGHMMTPYLPALGHETFTCIANCEQTQLTWLMENASQEQIAGLRSQRDIVTLQIETFRPDILYATDPVYLDSAMINALSWRPKLCIGWRAAPTPLSADFSAYDVMLTSDDRFRSICEARGARRVETYYPGHPAWINTVLGPPVITHDIVFSGQAGGLHRKRRDYLARILPLLETRGVRVGLLCPDPFPEYPALEALREEPVFGLDMYRTLRNARMTLNVLIDSASPDGINMRDFEATGVGSLVIESGASANRIFDNGTECFCFETVEETVSGILDLLNKPDLLNETAQAGHRKCMGEYEMNMRARRFMAICEDALA
ncbi:glycosyltransferase [Rhodospirillum sp. A1_3_36]|uniref:glycosyltransferase family protein n=1 Tax=Rhodospirillum sp. A1_3_36 TaxID=3391666 RepID=UPI0039A70CE3